MNMKKLLGLSTLAATLSVALLACTPTMAQDQGVLNTGVNDRWVLPITKHEGTTPIRVELRRFGTRFYAVAVDAWTGEALGISDEPLGISEPLDPRSVSFVGGKSKYMPITGDHDEEVEVVVTIYESDYDIYMIITTTTYKNGKYWSTTVITFKTKK